MKPHQSLARLLVGILAVALVGNVSAQVAHLTLQSEPGDFIGGGLTYDITYTPYNGSFFSAGVRTALPSGEPAKLLFALGVGQTPFALLIFGTDQLGIPIQQGFYPDAQRADFATVGHPGLDISFNHNGCNALTGKFTVQEFTYSPSLGIQSFSASFEQHCEGAQPALFGTFTFSAVPEPSLVGLLALAVASAFGLKVRRTTGSNF